MQREHFAFPSRRDPILQKLHETELPAGVTFDLLFGYRGAAAGNGELTDGTVRLSSVLDARMQSAAAAIYGFDEDHISLLESPAVLQKINELLAADLPADDSR